MDYWLLHRLLHYLYFGVRAVDLQFELDALLGVNLCVNGSIPMINANCTLFFFPAVVVAHDKVVASKHLHGEDVLRKGL